MGERERRINSSGLAFAAAYVVLVLGVFVALGGTAYAQQTPADDQYKEVVVNVFTPPTATAPESSVVAEALPSTGVSLLGTALLGAALVATGLLLRRRQKN